MRHSRILIGEKIEFEVLSGQSLGRSDASVGTKMS